MITLYDREGLELYVGCQFKFYKQTPIYGIERISINSLQYTITAYKIVGHDPSNGWFQHFEYNNIKHLIELYVPEDPILFKNEIPL